MKAIVTTTIETTLDLDTLKSTHRVEINDEDGISEVSLDVLGHLLIGAMRSATRGIEEKFPDAARRANKNEEDKS